MQSRSLISNSIRYCESVKVAAYQGPLLDAGVERALDLVRERVRECEAQGVGVLCCPEAFVGGLADYHDDPASFAIRSEDLDAVLTPLASDTVTTIVGFSEIADDKLYNAAAVFQRGQVSGLYRKVHPAIRRSVYAAGSQMPVFRVHELTFGILICNDSNYPELARTMRGQGATVLFIPTNNGLPKGRASIEVNAAARECDVSLAVENRCWVVRADVLGENQKTVSYGSSEVVDPSGRIVQEARGTDLLVAEIPTSESAPT